MKTIQFITKIPIILCSFMLIMNSCKKDDLQDEKMIHILINGYNGGDNSLLLTIDTTILGKNIKNGQYIKKPNSNLTTTLAYPYQGNKKRILSLTDTITKKIVYSKELPSTGSVGLFNFVLLDGKELDLKIPASDPGKNKLGFYIHFPESKEPVDIILYRFDNIADKEYRSTIAKNITAGSWTYLDYEIPEDFKQRHLLRNSMVQFVKPNTKDQWAFKNDKALSEFPATTFPREGEKGLVFPIFIAPNSTSDKVSLLYYYSDRFL